MEFGSEYVLRMPPVPVPLTRRKVQEAQIATDSKSEACQVSAECEVHVIRVKPPERRLVKLHPSHDGAPGTQKHAVHHLDPVHPTLRHAPHHHVVMFPLWVDLGDLTENVRWRGQSPRPPDDARRPCNP